MKMDADVFLTGINSLLILDDVAVTADTMQLSLGCGLQVYSKVLNNVKSRHSIGLVGA